MNSVKMKLAVIFGVWQMSIGICLKGSNCMYKGEWISFFFEFIPQIVIMMCMFGYMDMLIVWKWLTDWEGRTMYSPSIISTMIDMFLNGGNPTIPTDDPIIGTWQEQTKVENILLYIVLACIPLMLFVKPIAGALMAPKKTHNADDDLLIIDKAVRDATGKVPTILLTPRPFVPIAQKKTDTNEGENDDDNFKKAEEPVEPRIMITAADI